MKWWQWIITCFILYSLAKDIPRSKNSAKKLFEKWTWVRLSSVGWAFLALLVVMSAAIILTQAPILFKITWMYFFNSEGTNIMIAPIMWGGFWIGLIVFLLVVILLPEFAFFEENFFRKGGNTVRKLLVNSFLFGIVHMTVGVPLAVALALSLAGIVFHTVYLREYLRWTEKGVIGPCAESLAVKSSTAVHLTYNTILISLAGVYLILSVMA